MRETNKTSSAEDSKRRSTLWEFIPAPFLAATLAYCLLLYFLSSVSSFPISSPFRHFDKVVHFCLYAGLSATVAMGLHRARREYSAKVLFLIPVGFSIIYGLNDEVHQLFVKYRTFEVGDIAVDAVGAAAAAAFLLFVYRRNKSKR